MWCCAIICVVHRALCITQISPSGKRHFSYTICIGGSSQNLADNGECRSFPCKSIFYSLHSISKQNLSSCLFHMLFTVIILKIPFFLNQVCEFIKPLGTFKILAPKKKKNLCCQMPKKTGRKAKRKLTGSKDKSAMPHPSCSGYRNLLILSQIRQHLLLEVFSTLLIGMSPFLE